MSDNTFYLTTPIYYVNARPHIGHAYTTIVADVLARRHRLLGEDTFFLTGTDEHGQKIERSAAAAGVPPQQFADQVSKSFEDLWHRMGITHNDYIRTTSPKHKRGVQHLFSELYKNGFIYLASYTGSYCVSDETFVDAPVGTPCPDCGRLLEEVTEENFFFKLSAFQLPLLDLIESDTIAITPDSRKNEVLSFLRGNTTTGNVNITTEVSSRPEEQSAGAERPAGELPTSSAGTPYNPGALKDLSISRSSFTWGIPVPEPAASAAAQKHVIYVWLDALANYMTAIGYGSDDPAEQAKFKNFWPADLHLVGKEIIRFHCVYWPAFLLALNPKLQHQSDEKPPTLSPDEHQAWAKDWLPKAITAHGWLLFDDSKMSKSKGNIVRTETILDAFGDEVYGKQFPNSTKADRDLFASDVLRYFLLAEIPWGESGEFSFEAIVARYNGDLASGYGNLVSRSLSMIANYRDGSIPKPKHLNFMLDSVAEQSKMLQAQSVEVVSSAIRVAFLSSLTEESTKKSYSSAIALYLAFLSKRIGAEFFRFKEEDVLAFRSFLGDEKYAEQTISSYSSAIKRLRDFASTYKIGTLRDVVFRAAAVSDATRNEVIAPFNVQIGEYKVFLATVDTFFANRTPWKLAKLSDSDSQVELGDTLYTAAESIRIITALLHPILPYATSKVWAQLGLGSIEQAAADGELKNLQWGGLKPGTKLGPLGPIFPRADKGLAQMMTEMENPTSHTSENPRRLVENHISTTLSTDPAAPPRSTPLSEHDPLPVAGSTAHTSGPSHQPSHADTVPSAPFNTVASQTPITATPTDAAPQIAIDDFAKIELRVAQILVAERIPKADKLLRLEVDLGPHGKRQILSGIAEWYTPEDLIGRRIVVITNLAPRKMRGLESHGMLLAASNGEAGKPVLATFGEDIALGSRLK